MAGKHSRTKGRRFENEVVGVLRANGYNANRISEAGLPGPDIATFGGRQCEAKIREELDTPDGARLVLEGLQDATIFFFREDYGPIMVAMELDELFDLLDWRYEMGFDDGNSPHMRGQVGADPSGGENATQQMIDLWKAQRGLDM